MCCSYCVRGRLLLSKVIVFFFCKQKTAYEMRISDWSSDVCSSDLRTAGSSSGSLPWLLRSPPASARESSCGRPAPSAALFWPIAWLHSASPSQSSRWRGAASSTVSSPARSPSAPLCCGVAAPDLLHPDDIGDDLGRAQPLGTISAIAGYSRAVSAARNRPWQTSHVDRSEEHTSELRSLMRISYAVFCLKKKINHK